MRTWTLRTTQGAMTAACVLIAMVAGFREVGARAGRDTDAVDSSLRDGDDVAVGVGNGERLGSAPQPEEAAPAAQTPGRDPDEAGPVVIDPVPVTRIQEIDAGTSTIPLFRVRHAFITADGLVGVAADPGTVYFLSLDGELRGSVGRSGAGPGEFRSLSNAWMRGDTLEAYDNALMRLTRITPDSVVSVAPTEPSGTSTVIPGPLPEGRWAMAAVQYAGPGRRDSMVVRVFSWDTPSGKVVRSVSGMSRWEYPGGGGGVEPFSARSRYAVAGGNIYVADTSLPEIVVLSAAGDVVRTVRWAHEPEAPSRGDLMEILEGAITRADPDRRGMAMQYRSAPIPERLPAFWDFDVDDLGIIWIAPYVPTHHTYAPFPSEGSPEPWQLIDTEGVMLGTVRLPANLRPTHITSDLLVGIERDELGVESVAIYSLRRN